MGKKAWLFVCVALIAMAMVSVCVAQETETKNEKNVAGTVDEVAPDGSYVMINVRGTLEKVKIPADMQEYFNMEKGDQVEIVVEEVANGEWEAVDYDYL